MEFYKKRVRSRIKTYCEATYEKISKDNMKMGKGVFNNRCQLNATQKVYDNKASEVYSCIALNGDTPVVHFINKNKKGIFVDNTLGFEYVNYEYYLIKKVDESEFNKMDEVLMNHKKNLLELHSSGFINKLLGVNEYNVGV